MEVKSRHNEEPKESFVNDEFAADGDDVIQILDEKVQSYSNKGTSSSLMRSVGKYNGF